jgi:cell division protein ZapA
MPEVEIFIGGRSFEVACQAGEEHYLKSAAEMLNAEANELTNQIGRIPEARMLLMAGLMLADKTAAFEDRLKEAQKLLDAANKELETLRNAPRPEPERIEVPVVPEDVTERLAELAANAESLADVLEARAGGSSGT